MRLIPAASNFTEGLATFFLFALPLTLFAPVVYVLQGINEPGNGTNFTFTIPAHQNSLSIFFVAQTNASYSYLFLKKDGVPTERDFDFVSRSDLFTNRICIEPPEFDPSATNYGLRVFTPRSSTPHAFIVARALNATDRSPIHPALKPPSFKTIGVLTNSTSTPGKQWQVFQVDVPRTLPSWSITVQTISGPTPSLYVRKDLPPDTNVWFKASIDGDPRQIVLTNGEATAGTWLIGVHLSTVETHTVYSISAEGTPSEGAPYFETADGSLAMSNGVFQMRAIGPTNATLVLEGSSTLIDWMPLVTNTLSNGPWNIPIATTTNSCQFFRLECR